MAHAKETPRQKMINLMYVVFIAMLALQIDQEIIRSYNDTKGSLEETRLLTQEKNKIFEQTLQQKAKITPESFEAPYQKYLSLKKQVDDLVAELESSKEAMYKFVDLGTPTSEDDFNFNALNNTDASTHYFFENANEAKFTKSAQSIITKINGLKGFIIENFSNDKRMEQVLARANKSLVTESKKGNKKKWLVQKFYNQPLVAALSNIEVIQTEARNIESDVLANLLQEKVDADIKFDAYEAIVNAPDVVLQGQPATAKVVIGNYSNALPNLNITGVDKVQNGQGIKSLSTSTVGDNFSFSGNISFSTANGKTISLPFNHTYKVIAGAKEVAFESGALLAADKMQVLYRGLANPISGSILGADNSQTTLTASGASVTKVGGGKWNVTPTSGNTTVLTISGKGPKGPISQSFTFRIKGLPTPVGTIRDQNVVSMPASSIPNQRVSVSMPDFDWPVSFTVNSFMFKVPGKAAMTVNGSSMESVAALTKNLRPGDICYVYNINASASGIGNQGLKKIPAIVINVQ